MVTLGTSSTACVYTIKMGISISQPSDTFQNLKPFHKKRIFEKAWPFVTIAVLRFSDTKEALEYLYAVIISGQAAKNPISLHRSSGKMPPVYLIKLLFLWHCSYWSANKLQGSCVEMLV